MRERKRERERERERERDLPKDTHYFDVTLAVRDKKMI